MRHTVDRTRSETRDDARLLLTVPEAAEGAGDLAQQARTSCSLAGVARLDPHRRLAPYSRLAALESYIVCRFPGSRRC